MAEQVRLSEHARADLPRAHDAVLEIKPDLAYRRLAFVNVGLLGSQAAGDRGWVLIDAGLLGAKRLIIWAAQQRFGAGARPSAIILTHGHFDHVGSLESLASEWQVPVYAH